MLSESPGKVKLDDPTSAADPTTPQVQSRTDPTSKQNTEIRFHHSASLPRMLSETGCSLLISTYQAGQLVAVNVTDKQLTFSFRKFVLLNPGG